MTISTSVNKVVYAGNGATTAFTFNFPAVAASDISVIYTDALGNITTVPAGQYVLTLNPALAGSVWSVGGSVTYTLNSAPIPSGSSLTIMRVLPQVQSTSFANQAATAPTSIEQALDYLTMLIQQFSEAQSRTLLAPVGDTGLGVLPAPALRANKLFGWDSTGENPIAVTSLTATIAAWAQTLLNYSTLAIAQSQFGVTGYYTPEMFGAKGDMVTDDAPAINNMFETIPSGSTIIFGPKYYRVKKQAGTNYGLRLRRSFRILGAFGGGSEANAAIVYDNSFGQFDNVLLIQPPGTENNLNIFTIHGLEIGGLYFVPFAASLGFPLTLFNWDPTKEYSLYANDIIHFDIRGSSSGFGAMAIDRCWIHDCYIYGSGGPNGGQGTGVSLCVDCAIDASGAYTNVFERIHAPGGMRFNNMGDSNTVRDIRFDTAKGGIEWTSGPGAVEQLIEQINFAGMGPAIYWHWGKATFRCLNLEAHGLFVHSPDVALIDMRMDVTGGLVENGIIFDSITVGDQTASTGGASTPLTNLIYINNANNTVFRRVNMYSSAVTQTGIFIDTNCTGTRVEGPLTRQALAAITNLVEDHGVGTYGVDEALGGGNLNAPITLTAPWFNTNMKMRKNATGFVSLSGAIGIGTMATGTMLTLPVGFRPDASRVFAVATNASGTASVATVQVNSVGVVALVAFTGAPTAIFLDGVRFKEATHDAIVSGT